MSEPDEPIFDPVRFGALVRRTLDRAGNDEALFEDIASGVPVRLRERELAEAIGRHVARRREAEREAARRPGRPAANAQRNEAIRNLVLLVAPYGPQRGEAIRIIAKALKMQIGSVRRIVGRAIRN